jgi:LysR family nitrogen assimilation transcriptional regulator
MTPRQIKYFLEIARARSFTRAAGFLHVAQPALSRQMQQLEDDLGVKLFIRTDSGVLLTDAGELLLKRAPGLLEQYRSVRAEISGFAAHPSGRLELGMPPSLFHILTTTLITETARRYSDLELSVEEDISTDLHAAVVGGKIDLALVSSTEPLSGLASRVLVKEPMMLIGPASDVMEPYVSIESLSGLRLASTRRPNAVRTVLEDALSDRGVEVRFVMESSSTRLILSSVESGWARAVLPYSAAADLLAQGRVSASRVSELTLSWMLISGRYRSARSIEVIDALISELVQHQVEAGRWPGAVLAD